MCEIHYDLRGRRLCLKITLSSTRVCVCTSAAKVVKERWKNPFRLLSSELGVVYFCVFGKTILEILFTLQERGGHIIREIEVLEIGEEYTREDGIYTAEVIDALLLYHYYRHFYYFYFYYSTLILTQNNTNWQTTRLAKKHRYSPDKLSFLVLL